MLSLHVMRAANSGQTRRYYCNGAEAELTQSHWYGQGAARLGLSGPVDPALFQALLDGQVPGELTPSRRSVRHDRQACLGIDLTLSAPKSVSLQALVGGDTQLLALHDQAVAATLDQAEQRAVTRRKVQGISQLEVTGNLVIACFRQQLSRAQDPHLHTHAVLGNLTQRSDGAWRALRHAGIRRARAELGAYYQSELTRLLQQHGYVLRYEQGHSELAHITDAQITAFSQRRQQIDAALAAQGLSRSKASGAQKEAARLSTRPAKTQIDRPQLQQHWHAQAAAVTLDLSTPAAETAPSFEPDAELTAAQAVHYAVWHLTERQAVITQGQLIKTALSRGDFAMGQVMAAIAQRCQRGWLLAAEPLYSPVGSIGEHNQHTYDHWQARLQRSGLTTTAAQARLDTAIARGALVKGSQRYTTPKQLAREQAILDFEQQGRGRLAPLTTAAQAEAWLARTDLNAGQRRAATLIVTSRHQIVGIQGYAGVGKSHMLQAVCHYAQAKGHPLQLIAPYGSHVKALQQLGAPARTIAGWLQVPDQGLSPGSLLVVDEAGVIPSQTMHRLLTLATAAQARVVLLGDTGQMTAIEAGRPFAQLQQAGMATALMDDIQRQKNPVLKQAVEQAARGRPLASLEHLPEIQQITDATERYQRLAELYAAAPSQRNTLIITGTNAARRAINQAVRQQLGLQGRPVGVLLRRDLTQAERSLADNFRAGDVILPEQAMPGAELERGQLYQVLAVTGPDQLAVRIRGASADVEPTLKVNPAHYSNLSVYQPETIELAAGDIIRINRTSKLSGVVNGDRCQVTAINNHTIKLQRLGIVPGNLSLGLWAPLFIDHAYASTVSSIQGLDDDLVLADYDTTSPTTHALAHYVTISRARHRAVILTDNQAALPAAITRLNPKHAALDVILRQPKAAIPASRRQTATRPQQEVALATADRPTAAGQPPESRIPLKKTAAGRSQRLTAPPPFEAARPPLQPVKAELSRGQNVASRRPVAPTQSIAPQTAQADRSGWPVSAPRVIPRRPSIPQSKPGAEQPKRTPQAIRPVQPADSHVGRPQTQTQMQSAVPGSSAPAPVKAATAQTQSIQQAAGPAAKPASLQAVPLNLSAQKPIALGTRQVVEAAARRSIPHRQVNQLPVEPLPKSLLRRGKEVQQPSEQPVAAAVARLERVAPIPLSRPPRRSKQFTQPLEQIVPLLAAAPPPRLANQPPIRRFDRLAIGSSAPPPAVTPVRPGPQPVIKPLPVQQVSIAPTLKTAPSVVQSPRAARTLPQTARGQAVLVSGRSPRRPPRRQRAELRGKQR